MKNILFTTAFLALAITGHSEIKILESRGGPAFFKIDKVSALRHPSSESVLEMSYGAESSMNFQWSESEKKFKMKVSWAASRLTGWLAPRKVILVPSYFVAKDGEPLNGDNPKAIGHMTGHPNHSVDQLGNLLRDIRSGEAKTIDSFGLMPKNHTANRPIPIEIKSLRSEYIDNMDYSPDFIHDHPDWHWDSVFQSNLVFTPDIPPNSEEDRGPAHSAHTISYERSTDGFHFDGKAEKQLLRVNIDGTIQPADTSVLYEFKAGFNLPNEDNGDFNSNDLLVSDTSSPGMAGLLTTGLSLIPKNETKENSLYRNIETTQNFKRLGLWGQPAEAAKANEHPGFLQFDPESESKEGVPAEFARAWSQGWPRVEVNSTDNDHSKYGVDGILPEEEFYQQYRPLIFARFHPTDDSDDYTQMTEISKQLDKYKLKSLKRRQDPFNGTFASSVGLLNQTGDGTIDVGDADSGASEEDIHYVKIGLSGRKGWDGEWQLISDKSDLARNIIYTTNPSAETYDSFLAQYPAANSQNFSEIQKCWVGLGGADENGINYDLRDKIITQQMFGSEDSRLQRFSLPFFYMEDSVSSTGSTGGINYYMQGIGLDKLSRNKGQGIALNELFSRMSRTHLNNKLIAKDIIDNIDHTPKGADINYDNSGMPLFRLNGSLPQEKSYGQKPVAANDSDNDGIPNMIEKFIGLTWHDVADSDNDQLSDKHELAGIFFSGRESANPFTYKDLYTGEEKTFEITPEDYWADLNLSRINHISDGENYNMQVAESELNTISVYPLFNPISERPAKGLISDLNALIYGIQNNRTIGNFDTNNDGIDDYHTAIGIAGERIAGDDPVLNSAEDNWFHFADTPERGVSVASNLFDLNQATLPGGSSPINPNINSYSSASVNAWKQLQDYFFLYTIYQKAPSGKNQSIATPQLIDAIAIEEDEEIATGVELYLKNGLE